jgi:hypothetical protein
MGNGNSILPFVAANGKQKFVFLDQQMINGNHRVLFQQMRPSMGAVQWQKEREKQVDRPNLIDVGQRQFQSSINTILAFFSKESQQMSLHKYIYLAFS